MTPLVRLKADTTAEEVAKVVRWDGACIVEGLVDPDQLDTVAQDILPYVEQTPTSNSSFLGLNTRRTGGLMGRSAMCRELIMHPLVLAAGKLILAEAPTMQLMNTEIISIGPGEPAQPLHKDQQVWAYQFPPMFEPEFSVIWPMVPFTKENGATRLILGSHREGGSAPADEELTQQAEMVPGDIVFFTGSIYHAGGENRSQGTRHGLNVAYALGWLRQEENQYLAVPREVAATLSDEELKLMGYVRGGPALGSGVDKSDPLGIFRPELARPNYVNTDLTFA